jgi:tetratricopeptide (TPR) repeat protein
MENHEGNQETDKYGNVTFGEASKFLIDIIGQNVILDYISKKIENKKDAEKKREEFKQKLDRMYRGQAVYRKFATAERESPQWYVEQFFKDLEKENKYKLPHFVMIIVDSFTWQLFYAIRSHTPFEKSKKETALFLLRKEIFGFINLKDKPFDDGYVINFSNASIITFLTDSYGKIFTDVRQKYNDNEGLKKSKIRNIELMLRKIFENKKTLHGKIEDFYDDNADKYPKLDTSDYSPNYRQNIHNWQNEEHDPTWKTLEPILDFLQNNNGTAFVHRLIGQYFLRNARKALENIFHISQLEQEKIIVDIVTMINENRNPKEFYTDNDFEFFEQINLIWMCLVYQYQNDFNPLKTDEIIKVIESKCTHSKKFFSPWLKARAKVFENGETLKDNKEIQDIIINGYKEAYYEGIAYAGEYLGQFLLEAILINSFCNKNYADKKIDNYHGYGYALEIFGDDKKKLFDLVKKEDNLQIVFVNILYSDFNPTGKIVSQNFPSLHSILEFQNEAIQKNNKGLEFDKAGNHGLAICCFIEALLLNPVYVNAYSSRGNVYSKMGKQFIKDALIDFNMALLLEPKHENTLVWRGWLLFKNGQFNNAITDLTKVIEINPKDSEAYLRRGICYFKMEDLDYAIEDYSKAIEINPSYAEAYYNRAVVYKLIGNNDKAQEDYCKAIQIEPEFFLKEGQEFFV